jgi:hypothetical protein
MVKTEIEDQRQREVARQWDFLHSHETMFRKSSLIVIL